MCSTAYRLKSITVEAIDKIKLIIAPIYFTPVHTFDLPCSHLPYDIEKPDKV